MTTSLFIKTNFGIKGKPYGHKVIYFYDKEIPKLDSIHTCLAVISFDSAFNKDGSYYPQILLKEYKYIEEKVIRHSTHDLESSFN